MQTRDDHSIPDFIINELRTLQDQYAEDIARAEFAGSTHTHENESEQWLARARQRIALYEQAMGWVKHQQWRRLIGRRV